MVGAIIPRGSEENIPVGYERGEGAPVREDCFIRPEVPVLLPLPEPIKKIIDGLLKSIIINTADQLPMLTPLEEGGSSRAPQHDGNARDDSGRTDNNDANAPIAPRSHRKCGNDSRVT